MQAIDQRTSSNVPTIPESDFVEIITRRGEANADGLFYTVLHAGRPAEQVTYGDLCITGSRLRALCAEREITPGSHMLIILPHSADLIRAEFGAFYAGLVPSILAVPSFKLNKEHYLHEVGVLCRRIAPRLVLTTDQLALELGQAISDLPAVVLSPSQLNQIDEVALEPAMVSPDDILLLQHSSGSTGLKKGVELSHRAVLSQLRDYARALDMHGIDTIATWLPLYHDMGLIAATLLPLATGTPTVGLSPFEWVAKPATLLHAISTYKATLCWLPNFSYNFMSARIREDELDGIDLSSMRAFINCSEPVVAESHRMFLERFRAYGLRESALHSCYALAECTFAASQSGANGPCVEHIDRDQLLTERVAVPVAANASSIEIMSSGSRLSGCQIRIVDEDLEELPDRHVGEIVLRSAYLFEGYFRLSEVTSEVLRSGWYYTGDLGYRVGEELFVTGRKKDLIIIGGKNFYPQDIERIVSSDPDIVDGRTVALGRYDSHAGTQQLIVIAESQISDQGDREAICNRIRRNLVTKLDCVASDVRIVPHFWLLKTSSGKIARGPNLSRYQELLEHDDTYSHE